MNIVRGYFNINRFLPTEVVVVFEKKDIIYGRYPWLEEFMIPKESMNYYLNQYQWIPENGFKFIRNGEYGFALDENQVFIGTRYTVVDSLAMALEKRTSERELKMVFDYILRYPEDEPRPN